MQLKQLNVIEFYVKKEIATRSSDKNNYIKNNVLAELENIKYNYWLNVDSDKFKEIALYYIKSKLLENLIDSKTKNIFTIPVISPEGYTYEKDGLDESNDYIENKLVSEICKILKESEEKLNLENFKKIKILLTSKETADLYKNPIVTVSGENKGETIEDDNKVFGYTNIVIKNIIEDIRELLDDDFFNFEMVESDEIISEKNGIANNNSELNIFGFEEV